MIGFFQAFGLTIESEIGIPAKHHDAIENADVKIIYGSVPQKLDQPVIKGASFMASPGELLLTAGNIARYYIRDGNTIIIEPGKDAGQGEIRLFITGSAFAALLHQRNLLIFHASSVAINGYSVMIAGLSGSGKSTTAKALIDNTGGSLLADDISIAVNSGDAFLSLPGFRQMKLWKDSLEYFSVNPEFQTKVREGLEKHFADNLLTFASCPAPIKYFIVLNNYNESTVRFEELKGTTKFEVMNRNVFRPRFQAALSEKSEIFRAIGALAGKIRVFRISRPRSGNTIQEIVSVINSQILNRAT